MRNKVNKIVANAKNQYYLNAFSRFRSNSRKKWQLINELSGNSRPSSKIDSLNVGNLSYESPNQIADQFNNFFNEIALDLDSNLTRTESSPYAHVHENTASFLYSLLLL